MAPPKNAPDSQTLTSKDATLFRQLVRFYEGKQYKKGIKNADQILKRVPDHGETLAMKGLIVSCMTEERKEEAFELVRKGLKHNLKSHVCWHVYGLLYRSHSEYDEAIKCYKNALRMEPESIQVLRDLAGLQIQLRDIPGFVETRHQLLILKPANRANWISFAVAHHLDKNYELAVQVLDAYEGTQQEEPASEAYERSELLLYKASVLAEGGKHAEALSLLDGNQEKILDRLGMLEIRAQLLLALDRSDEAEKLYRELLNVNPDNYRHHAVLRRAAGMPHDPTAELTGQQLTRVRELYSQLQAAHPRSSAAFRIPLDFETGEAFTAAADAYVRRFLQKGVPSLFTDLKSLYSNPAKAEALGALFQRLLDALTADGAFPPLAGQSEPQPASPQALLWTMAYLAQHHDRMGDTEKALGMLQRCAEHTPTLIELYTLKAKILKHAGDVEGAAAAADKARSMDLADRFLNSTAAKWKFRAGDVEGAEATAAMFTKDGDQVNNLFDMQCTWYEIECGRAWLRRGVYGKALKNFMAVSKHFFDIKEDQFDFHHYCIRKMTLRAYIEMLRMEDSLYSAVPYVKAAYDAIHTYVLLHDSPASSEKGESERVAAMSAEDRRRHKQQQRKEAAKAKKRDEDAAKAKEAAAAEAAAKDKAGAKKPAAAKRKADPDPDGAKLAGTSDPLGEATKLLEKLKEHADSRLETQRWAFEVYMRKGKLLLALSAVKRALAIGGASDPIAHSLVVRFALLAQAQDDSQSGTPAVVQQVISAQLQQMLGGKALPEYQAQFLQQHSRASLLHLAAAAEMGALLEPSQKEASAQLILSGTEAGEISLRHDDCVTVHKLLQEQLAAPTAADAWKQRCGQVFAWSPYFEGQKRLPLEEPIAEAPSDANGVANGVDGLKLHD